MDESLRKIDKQEKSNQREGEKKSNFSFVKKLLKGESSNKSDSLAKLPGDVAESLDEYMPKSGERWRITSDRKEALIKQARSSLNTLIHFGQYYDMSESEMSSREVNKQDFQNSYKKAKTYLLKNIDYASRLKNVSFMNRDPLTFIFNAEEARNELSTIARNLEDIKTVQGYKDFSSLEFLLPNESDVESARDVTRFYLAKWQDTKLRPQTDVDKFNTNYELAQQIVNTNLLSRMQDRCEGST